MIHKDGVNHLQHYLEHIKLKIDLGIPAIGGKDSMSGSFKDIDVPPTLVSFAVEVVNAKNIISPEFKKASSTVSILNELNR